MADEGVGGRGQPTRSTAQTETRPSRLPPQVVRIREHSNIDAGNDIPCLRDREMGESARAEGIPTFSGSSGRFATSSPLRPIRPVSLLRTQALTHFLQQPLPPTLSRRIMRNDRLQP